MVRTNVPVDERTPAHRRAEAAVTASGMPGAVLYRVPPNYYKLPLRARAKLLGAPADALCKSLLLENVAHEASGADGSSLATARYVFVV